MDIEQVRDFTLSLFGVTEDQPFGDDNVTFRVEGKIFLCLWLGSGRYEMRDGMRRFACKLSPERNEELREQYEAVTPAFHWNKKHWSDVFYEQLEPELVMTLIKESYELIVSKLPKAVREKKFKNPNADGGSDKDNICISIAQYYELNGQQNLWCEILEF